MTLHPLESITADEVAAAVKLFREHHADEKSFFSSIGLKEPEKQDVLGEKKAPRIVQLSGVDQQLDGGFVSLVDIAAQKVLSTIRLSQSAQVAYNYADIGIAITLTKSSAQWLEAVKARGIDVETEQAMALIQIDPWPANAAGWPYVPSQSRPN